MASLSMTLTGTLLVPTLLGGGSWVQIQTTALCGIAPHPTHRSMQRDTRFPSSACQVCESSTERYLLELKLAMSISLLVRGICERSVPAARHCVTWMEPLPALWR